MNHSKWNKSQVKQNELTAKRDDAKDEDNDDDTNNQGSVTDKGSRRRAVIGVTLSKKKPFLSNTKNLKNLELQRFLPCMESRRRLHHHPNDVRVAGNNVHRLCNSKNYQNYYNQVLQN